jgi:hypothetical protein
LYFAILGSGFYENVTGKSIYPDVLLICHPEENAMSWTDWACLSIFVLGFLLFLVGANIYNVIVGYSGIYLFIGAIAAYLIIYVYKELTKTTPIQNP